jgi:hypothetical protein
VTEHIGNQTPGRVFISYAHDDATHEDLVRDFWWFLRRNGVDAHADLVAEDRHDWAEWMVQQIRDAGRVLVVASPAYARRAEGDAHPDEGRGVQWEAGLIRDLMYSDQKAGLRWVLPVVLPGCSPNDIPLWLRPASAVHYRVSEFTVSGAERLLRVLTGQPLETEPPLGTIPLLPPRPRPEIKPPTCHVIIWTGAEEIREKSALKLQELGFDPKEMWCTARAVSYRVNSAQTSQVSSQMEGTGFTCTVVAPGLEDYLVRQLYIDGPYGRRFRIFDASAHQTICSLAEQVAENYEGVPEGARFVVTDFMGPNGQRRRLDLNETIHMAGVRDKDRLGIAFEVDKWRRRQGRAFISYVREDSDNVDRLQQIIEAAGVNVWRDTADLWPGEDWRTKIRQAITDNTLVYIACFSSNSLARTRSYQNEELALAVEQMRLRRTDSSPWLIPVRFDDCVIPDYDLGGGRTLRSIQWIDLFGEHIDQGAARLTEVVLRLLG